MAKVTKTEMEARKRWVAGLFRKGFSKTQVTEKIEEKYGVKPCQAAIYCREAYKYLKENEDAFVKNLRKIQLERLENMLSQAMDRGDLKTANDICNTINKTFGLYETKIKADITSNVIRFQFDEGVDVPDENNEVEEDMDEQEE